jgi:hypothetical protein
MEKQVLLQYGTCITCPDICLVECGNNLLDSEQVQIQMS